MRLYTQTRKMLVVAAPNPPKFPSESYAKRETRKPPFFALYGRLPDHHSQGHKGHKLLDLVPAFAGDRVNDFLFIGHSSISSNETP